MSKKLIAQNRRAKFDYFIDNVFEAGLVLTGTEVKALRNSKASINEAYASIENEEAWLINAYIPEYGNATNRFNHAPRRHRKLLLRRRELNKLMGALRTRGVTLIPLQLYFDERGIAKIEIGLARGIQLWLHLLQTTTQSLFQFAYACDKHG